MPIFAGESITIVGRALDPVHGEVIADADASVEFYAPGKSPITVPDDRSSDEGPFDMSFDPDVRNRCGPNGAYVTVVDTTGWDAGTWSFLVTLSGSVDSWEYGTVTVRE